MSSVDRPLSGPVLVHHLSSDERTIDPDLVARHGRSARTLVKEGPLRLTIMRIAANGGLPAHKSEGPVSIHLLDGDLTVTAAGRDYDLSVGDVVVLAGDVEHSARSSTGGTFLLTVVHLATNAGVGPESAPTLL